MGAPMVDKPVEAAKTARGRGGHVQLLKAGGGPARDLSAMVPPAREILVELIQIMHDGWHFPLTCSTDEPYRRNRHA